MPRLRINDMYASASAAARRQPATLPPRYSSAAGGARFVKNIQQRFDTIQRVSQAIVEHQKNFFTHGAIAMNLPVLREIADELGLHESTIIARDDRQVHGHAASTFELKYSSARRWPPSRRQRVEHGGARAVQQFRRRRDPNKPPGQPAVGCSTSRASESARGAPSPSTARAEIAPANLRRRSRRIHQEPRRTNSSRVPLPAHPFGGRRTRRPRAS